MKKPLITKSTKKNAIILTIVLFIGYLIFNFFTVLEINYYYTDNIDVRLKHETEHIFQNISIENGSIKIENPRRFQEYEMIHVTDNSFYIQIYDTEGNIIFRSINVGIFKGTPKLILDFDEEFLLTDEKVNYQGLRVCYTKIIEDGKLYGYIQLATPDTRINKAIENIISFNLLTLPLAFILFVIVSLIFAKRTLNPINKIIEISEEISATNLEKRIDYEAESEDELGRLKATLNNLFDRLEFQINQISHFSDNASHQLMTPLTTIKTELEYALKKDHTAEEYQETLEIVNEQNSKMINIVKTLLILARDCEVCTPGKKVFNLTTLIKSDFSENWDNLNTSINSNDDIYLLGEIDYFKMAIENIISNAFKYSSNQPVNLDVDVKEKIVNIKITDKGIGIPESEKEKIFERFYRGEKVEAEGIKGYGLGLSLAKLVFTKMNGEIFIEDNEPNGSIFIIKLPVVKLQ